MGQAGAQREPSMEEILASIRKIIEKNDQTASQAEAASGQQPSATPLQAAPPAAMQVSAAPQVADDTQDNQDGEAEENPVSLAEVAAKMRPQAEPAVGKVLDDDVVDDLSELFSQETRSLGARRGPSDEAARGLRDVARALHEMDGEAQQADATLMQTPHAPQVPVEPVSHENESADSDDVVETAGTVAQSAVPEPQEAKPAIKPAPAQIHTDEDHDTANAGSLISVDAGAKIAQSFATLNAAMTSGAQRSFDEIAEDLLRPMLQAWLDDNLPTLVERLVREEIERVARGNRR